MFDKRHLARINDRTQEGGTRALKENETLIMALNEIAVYLGYGFFFHLANFDTLKISLNKNSTDLESRKPPPPE